MAAWLKEHIYEALCEPPVYLVGLFLALVSFIIYYPALYLGYASDDFEFVYYAKFATVEDLWTAFFPPLDNMVVWPYYRPAGLSLWSVVFWLHGENPFYQHLLSICLHFVNGLLVYILASDIGQNHKTAFCSSLIFITFPTSGETISWISSRFDISTTTFSLLYLISALRSTRSSVIASLIFLTLALLNKEPAIIAPALLILLVLLRKFTLPEFSTMPRTTMISVIMSILITFIYIIYRFLIFGKLTEDNTSIQLSFLQFPLDNHIQNFFRYILFTTSLLNISLLLQNSLELTIWDYLESIIIGFTIGCVVVNLIKDHQSSTYSTTPIKIGILYIGWMLISYIPLVGNPTSDIATFEGARLVYLPTIGICLLVASFLFYPAITSRPVYLRRLITLGRLVILTGIITLSVSTIRSSIQKWSHAGSEVQSILDQIRHLYPSVLPQTTFFLPPLADGYKGAYIFRNGIQRALQLSYNDNTLKVAKLEDAPKMILPRPERVALVQSQNNRLAHYLNEAEIRQRITWTQQVPHFSALSFDSGFYYQERSTSGEHVWRWMQKRGCMMLEFWGPQLVDVRMFVWSLSSARQIEISLNEQPIRSSRVTAAPQEILLHNLQMVQGVNNLCFKADASQSIQASIGGDDTRVVSIAVGNTSIALSSALPGPPSSISAHMVQFDRGIALLGYDLPAPFPLQPEQRMVLTLYWQNASHSQEDLLASVRITDRDGKIIAQKIALPTGADSSTPRGRQSRYWRGRFYLTLPPDLPHGMYYVLVSLYNSATMQQVPILSAQTPDNSVKLATCIARLDIAIGGDRTPGCLPS